MILWHGFEEPLFPALGIVDVQRTDGQAGVVRTLNDRLRTALGRTGNAYLVDLNACLTRRGAATFYDRRYWHMARAPYSREALADIAREQFKYLRALKGRQRKCLVLDCDDVLWGGVLGEEGIAGIKIGRAYPGSPYLELQQEILNLYHRGVVLALCSKNDASDVWDVFRNHPDMVLRENHIAAARINWNDKATNLREIAAELNLGLDALVFVDDSEVECDLVRRALPDVAVVHVPRDQAVDYRERIAAGGWFDTLTLSDEDRRRGAAYKAEGERQRLRTASTDLDSYFQSLEMVARIRKADRVTIPRIAQLTQKTNQFNMTTRRYSDEDISRFAADPATEVLTLSLEDRFGDAGLVGVAILRYEGATARLDTFLLSCRVLGRGVEDAFLGECLARAQRRHAAVAVGEFVATKKNQMAAGFYSARGFRPGASGHLELPLADWSRVLPSFFKRVEGPDEPASQQV
jgi:FkbH-like protein